MKSTRRVISMIAIVLLALTVPACGDDDSEGNGNQNNDDKTNQNNNDNDNDNNNEYGDPPDDPEELCEAACAAIYDDEDDGGCDTLFTDEDGGAVIEQTCVDWCLEDDKFRGGQWCVVTQAECSDDPRDMIEECFPDDYHPEPCSELGIWELEWIERERQAVQLLNERRTDGAQCGGESYPAVDALAKDELLECAARMHSDEMAETGQLDTVNEAGENTADRIEEVGFEANATDGLVNHGALTADHVVGRWFDDDSDHCDTVMAENFDHVGIGSVEGANVWWTLKLAEAGQ